MTLWDRIRAVLKSEGSDVADQLGKARDQFDDFLTQKERELEATPKERMDMLTDDIKANDAEFDRIIDKAEGRIHAEDASAEVRDSVAEVTGDVAPVTKPVMTDGSVEVVDVETGAVVTPEVKQAPPEADDHETASDDSSDEATSNDSAVSQDAAEPEAAPAEPARPSKPLPPPATQLAPDFEERKAKADDLLDELRGELGIDDTPDTGA